MNERKLDETVEGGSYIAEDGKTVVDANNAPIGHVVNGEIVFNEAEEAPQPKRFGRKGRETE